MNETLQRIDRGVHDHEHDELSGHQALVVRSSAMLGQNAELNNNVVIHCDVVNQNLTINGNASIKGSVLNSTIMCFGHLRIAGSCEKSTVYARGHISGFIVRQADVFSEQNVIIHREVQDSTVQAAASILAASAKLSSSRLSACDTIIAHRVKASSGEASELELGNVFLRRRKECILYRRMAQDAHELKTKREVLRATQDALERGSNLPHSQAQIQKLEADLEQVRAAAEKSAFHYHQLCMHWAHPEHYNVSVLSHLEAGTTIRIEEYSRVEERDRNEAEYSLNGQQLLARFRD